MIYVDRARHPFGRMKMCHMIADTSEELMAMAAKIGVQPKWVQDPGTPREHFDICQRKKQLALDQGAQELGKREFMLIIRDKQRRTQ